ncbi:MAG: tetratricopeptide repeat protein [Leptolyngbyaceae cyanobacterium bins.349]|nr:tetratricopeptide repeat protein [Leptolyngbyaceae cyanobacterium bins.349]
MKNHRWLSVAEYVMLVGSGVGSVATAASQQALYAVAPLSALFVLNLLNHRRLEQAAQETTDIAVSQLDQKFSNSLTTLQQQVQALPSPLHLASLRKDLQAKHQDAFNELFQHIQQLQQDVAQADWRTVSHDLAHLREQYAALTGSVAGVRESLSRLASFNQLEPVQGELAQLKQELAHLQQNLQALGTDQKLNNYRVLQDQITHINRRLNKLPAPFDATTLRQDIETVVKALGDMAYRRDLARVEAQVEKLAQQNEEVEGSVLPLKVVTNILKKQVDTVAMRLGGLESIVDATNGLPGADQAELVESLQATVTRLEQQVGQLPKTMNMVQLRSELQEVVADHLEPLQHQLDTVQQQTQHLDQQHRALRDLMHRLPQLMDTSALHREVKYLTNRVEWAETHLTELQSRVAQAPSYELVVDVGERRPHRGGQPLAARAAESEDGIAELENLSPAGSRAMLEQALQKAETRVIVVYPVPSPVVLDDAMMQRFQEFLERGGCLDIGWGHLEVVGDRQPRSIDERRRINPTRNAFLFNRLNQLTELKKHYPDQVRFKVLGTDEYFLVCDRAYAILGTQSVATTSTLFPEATVGLRSTDASVIQKLVERFDDPVLEAQDAIAFFQRAAARYDLGNRQGALADYTTVLAITPDDDVALNNRGLVYYDLEEKAAAIADFDAALQHNPDNFVAYTNRGYIRSEQGDKLGAIEDYTRAIQLNPNYAIAYFYRGLARTRLQNKPGAIQDYTEVIRLQPHDASAYFYRGLARANLGQRLDAMHDLRQAGQLFAGQGDTANYQQTLTAVKKLQKLMVIGNPGPSAIVANGTQGRA